MILRLLATVALGVAVAATAGPSLASSRDQAIQECVGRSAKYVNHVWGNFESSVYRSCMAQQGYQE
jgi:hypothetical protein